MDIQNVFRTISGVGGTLFDLCALQEEYRDEAGSVLEFDLYHAETLLPMSDDAVVENLMTKYLPCCTSESSACKVVDRSVLRFPGAVSGFTPGSHAYSPQVTSSLPAVYMAGDWMRQGPGTHGAKGLSQKKAYVTGLQAGNLAARSCGGQPVVRVIDAEPDELHVMAAKQAAKALQRGMQPLVGGAIRAWGKA